MNRKAHGFTIVELLIVIVVIGILATIGIVAYNGVSQKANNAAIISAASNSSKMIQTYIAEYGTYPYTVPTSSVTFCITTESGCLDTSGNTIGNRATFDTEMARVGAIPRSVPNSGGEMNGVVYQYVEAATVNGASQPFSLVYWLQGVNQDCGSPVVVQWYNTPTGKTRCRVNVPGPAHR
ncbi:prepilin-type N-terminal cleavage/methylation domain-containing protein [Candidatus Saccharibacteria bacterium]|nr:prepilin-type N-terminal cleavage/methylation domain-containing protein [Candidatus Saccharibacteria bacterium]